VKIEFLSTLAVIAPDPPASAIAGISYAPSLHG